MKTLISFLIFVTLLINCQSGKKTNSSDNIIVKAFSTGMENSNCYVVSQDGIGFIVDAGSNDPYITNYLIENKIEIKYIICTHSHICHILFAQDLKDLTGAKLLLHSEDIEHLNYYTKERSDEWDKNNELNKELFPYIEKFIQIKNNIDFTFIDVDFLEVGKMKPEILFTPGHTKGSICILLNKKLLFAGDNAYYGNTINMGINGDWDTMKKSVTEKIFTLDDDVIVYQGHGPSLSIKELKEKNS